MVDGRPPTLWPNGPPESGELEAGPTGLR